MPFHKSTKRKSQRQESAKVVESSNSPPPLSPQAPSSVEAPPRPKSLKIEPDDSVSSTMCDLSTPPTAVMKANEATKSGADVNSSLSNLPQSLHNILSQLVNQASTPSPLTPNKVFNPKSISEEQMQIGMKFDDILSSLFRQQQPTFPSSTTSAANLAASFGGTAALNSSTLNLLNAITQASQPSAVAAAAAQLGSSSTGAGVATAPSSMQVTIPLQTVLNAQNLTNPLSAVLQSQLLGLQQQQQQPTSTATLNLITGLGNVATASGTTSVTLQPIICNNPTINGIPLLLSQGSQPQSSNAAASHLQVSHVSQSLQKAAPQHSSLVSSHQATSQLLSSAAALPSNKSTTAPSYSIIKLDSSRPDTLYETVVLPSTVSSSAIAQGKHPQQNALPVNVRLAVQAGGASSSGISQYHSSRAPSSFGGNMDDRLERKRARNRDAARKCREKKITLISTLEDELNALHHHHENLLRQADAEEFEVNKLRSALLDHKKCGCEVALRNKELDSDPITITTSAGAAGPGIPANTSTAKVAI